MRFLSLMAVGLLFLVAVSSHAAQPTESEAPAPAVEQIPVKPPARAVSTADPSSVSLAHVHIVFERNGHFIDVTQTLRLTAAAGQVFRNNAGYSIPLPVGAEAPRPIGENKDPYRVLANSVVYLQPIRAEGDEVTIAFKLPIRDGRMGFRQQFSVPVRSAQVISTWTKKDPTLKGVGFGEPRMLELNSGMMALVMNGGELADGQIQIDFENLAMPGGELEQLLALIASLALLAYGAFFWVREHLRDKA